MNNSDNNSIWPALGKYRWKFWLCQIFCILMLSVMAHMCSANVLYVMLSYWFTRIERSILEDLVLETHRISVPEKIWCIKEIASATMLNGFHSSSIIVLQNESQTISAFHSIADVVRWYIVILVMRGFVLEMIAACFRKMLITSFNNHNVVLGCKTLICVMKGCF